MADLTGATLSEFQEAAPPTANEFQPAGTEQPDIIRHDPDTFAGLTAQRALITMYQQGLSPTGDDIKGVYNKALQDSTEFHRNIAQEQERAQLELQKRAGAVSSGILSAEEKARAAVEMQKTEQLEQFRQGPSAVAAAQAQSGQGLISKLPDADLQRLDGYASAYDTVSKLHGYFNNMIKPWSASGTGGTFGAGSIWNIGAGAAGLTSPEARAFNSYMESSLVPLGRGVFGDAAVAATKENIQGQMKDMLPNISDNDLTGGQKVFMMKDRIMQNLQTLRDDRAATGFDTTPIDRQIARINSDFRSDAVQKYNPLGNAPVVQNGISTVGTANMDAQLIASAGAAGAQMQLPPGGSASAFASPGGIGTTPQMQQVATQTQPQLNPQQQPPQQPQPLNAWGF